MAISGKATNRCLWTPLASALLMTTIIFFFVPKAIAVPDPARSNSPIAIVIHGGAGTILKENMTAETEAAYYQILNEALSVGHNILAEGGSSLDAVEQTIRLMEDSPLFNAGKGAVFTSIGTNELDASIMNGKDLQAGAVARVQRVKNPISLARKVMDQSPHVMMVGDGAEQFARDVRVELVEPDYFRTERRWQDLQKIKRMESERSGQQSPQPMRLDPENVQKFGTVGVVALDLQGNLAAGTSTGGMTNKRFGRVGDSPIIGAGTYADNSAGAVSATGSGEYFIRGVIAYDLVALVKYRHLTITRASQQVIYEKLAAMGGSGGVIAMDNKGNIAMVFNTAGMYRGFVDKQGKRQVRIYKDLD